jgi:hypothetical protein
MEILKPLSHVAFDFFRFFSSPKILAFYQERCIKPGRFDHASNSTLEAPSRFFDWKDAFLVVQPKSLNRWHRESFKVFWKWNLRMGRTAHP